MIAEQKPSTKSRKDHDSAVARERLRLAGLEAALAQRLQESVGHVPFRELARGTGFHAESVRRWVKGETCPNAMFLVAICQKYNIDADWLLCGREWVAKQVTTKASNDGTEIEVRLGIKEPSDRTTGDKPVIRVHSVGRGKAPSS